MLYLVYTAKVAVFCTRTVDDLLYAVKTRRSIYDLLPSGKGEMMTDVAANAAVSGGNNLTEDHQEETGTAVYHVNSRKGRVDPHGEDLEGKEILSRAGLSSDKYELFTVVDGKTGAEIKPDQTYHVKPGEHFRATIRGTDYSSVALPER